MFNRKEYMKQYNKKYREKNQKKHNEYNKQWAKNNIEKIKKKTKKYYQNNLEKIKKYNKEYRINNPEKIKELARNWQRNKRKTDIKFNLNCKISRAIHHSLKGNKAGRHWEILVGYSLKDLIKHLKRTIPKGYNWNDYINGILEIDHIIPISLFNFEKSDDCDFQQCWSLTNLRLLPKIENRIKFNKLDKPFQLTLAI